MAESQKVINSNSPSSAEERADFKRTQAYDPKHLKLTKLWGDKSSPEMFGKLGRGMTR